MSAAASLQAAGSPQCHPNVSYSLETRRMARLDRVVRVYPLGIVGEDLRAQPAPLEQLFERRAHQAHVVGLHAHEYPGILHGGG